MAHNYAACNWFLEQFVIFCSIIYCLIYRVTKEVANKPTGYKRCGLLNNGQRGVHSYCKCAHIQQSSMDAVHSHFWEVCLFVSIGAIPIIVAFIPEICNSGQAVVCMCCTLDPYFTKPFFTLHPTFVNREDTHITMGFIQDIFERQFHPSPKSN